MVTNYRSNGQLALCDLLYKLGIKSANLSLEILILRSATNFGKPDSIIMSVAALEQFNKHLFDK